nr:MAG TPA: hypothetical protein [Caudoviricetes sp.]
MIQPILYYFHIYTSFLSTPIYYYIFIDMSRFFDKK